MTGAQIANAIAERLQRDRLAVDGDFLKRVETGSDFLDHGVEATVTLTFESGARVEIGVGKPSRF